MKIPRAIALVPADGTATDRLALAYADRYRRRGVVQTEGGCEILLDLAEAVELADGAALALDTGRQIALAAAAEPLSEVRGPDLARLAWHIGNRHTPCEIRPDRLFIQRDHVLEDMLRGLGARVTAVDAPFRPEGGAYGHGRTHAHAPSPNAHADPNAHIPHRHG
ncbi:MAG: urease accessory protein UreE [Paracoccaceae bacterium]